MKKEIYTLLNDMDHNAESYEGFSADTSDAEKWMKSVFPKEKKVKNWRRYVAAAACVCVLGTAISPVGEKVYAEVSAAMYSISKILGIRKDLSPYQVVIGETVEKNGISATLNEVLQDDETLMISCVVQSEKVMEMEGGVYPHINVAIDGAQASVAFGGGSERVDEHSMVICAEVEMPGISPEEQMDMEMEFYVGEEKLGTIAFTVSGAELMTDTKTVELNKNFLLPDDTEVILEKYTTSDVNQKVYFTTSTGKCEYDLKLEGTDDLGNEAEFNLKSFIEGKGRMEVSTIDNDYVNENAKELTLTLYAAAFPKESGRMSDDFEQVGEPFTITLPTEG